MNLKYPCDICWCKTTVGGGAGKIDLSGRLNVLSN